MADCKLIAEIEAYSPWNEQEEADKAQMLYLLRRENTEALFTRMDRAGHFTASGWIVNPDFSRVLMVYHNLYHSWSWLGGHADGETDLLQTALREAREESGLVEVTPVQKEIFSLEILTVDGHEKHGEYVSSHLHLNVTYLLQAEDTQALREKPDENSGVAWFSPQGAIEASTEHWFQSRIYRKLNEKTAALLSARLQEKLHAD